jgi:hypothetical protein
MLIADIAVFPFKQKLYPIAAVLEWCPVLKYDLYRNAVLNRTLHNRN